MAGRYGRRRGGSASARASGAAWRGRRRWRRASAVGARRSAASPSASGSGVASSSGRGRRGRLVVGLASSSVSLADVCSPPNRLVRRSLETEPPNSASSDAVTTPAAMTNASSAGDERDLQPRARRALRLAQAERVVAARGRRVVAQVLGGSGSKRSGPSPRAPTRSGSRVRPPRARSGARRRRCPSGAPRAARPCSRSGRACAAPRTPARRRPGSSRWRRSCPAPRSSGRSWPRPRPRRRRSAGSGARGRRALLLLLLRHPLSR